MSNCINIEERFENIKSLIEKTQDSSILEKPFSRWLISTDRYFPQTLLSRPLRYIMTTSYSEIVRVPGIGTRKIEKLIEVLERVTQHVCGNEKSPRLILPRKSGPNMDSSVYQVAPEDLTESAWDGWRALIFEHQLENEYLGGIAENLGEIPQKLWLFPLGEFAKKTLNDLRGMAGYGESRVSLVLKVFSRVTQTLGSLPAEIPLGIRLLIPQIRQVSSWCRKVLNQDIVPPLYELQQELIQPLLKQLETDLGLEIVSIIHRRAGLDGLAETLMEIGTDLQMTREGVRQLAVKAQKAISCRWPEGRNILEKVHFHFQALSGYGEQSNLIRSILNTCFDLQIASAKTMEEILTAWNQAGREKLTPMTLDEVRFWAYGKFPDLPFSLIQSHLDEKGMCHTLASLGPIYFTNDPLDSILVQMIDDQSSLASVSVEKIAELLNEDVRNIRNRIDRDPRLIEDDLNFIWPAEHFSLFRCNSQWRIRLLTAENSAPRVESVSVTDLVNLIIGGLTQAGIGDATVWGVHRFAQNIMRCVHGATLPESVSPFILASVLVLHSSGLIRHMRRRRLRWDRTDGSLPARGKRGWVDLVMAEAGIPLTYDELNVALRARFQDYESYVLKQLHLTEDEEGEQICGFRYVPGVSQVVPPIIIPQGWELDLVGLNISQGIKNAVERIVSLSAKSPLQKQQFQRVAWIIRLCDTGIFGPIRWNQQQIHSDEEFY